MRRARPLAPLLAALALAAALPAAARAADPSLRWEGPGSGVTGWAILGYGDAVGAGVSYHTSLVPEGFIRDPGVRIHDNLDLEVGADFLNYYGYRVGPYDYGWNELLLRGGLLWDFWLTPRLAVYPKLDLGWGFGGYTGNYDPAYGPRQTFGGLFVEGAAGVIFKLQPRLALRGEIGSAGLKLGIDFEF